MDLVEYFKKPSSKRQKQYEAVRAIVLDKMPADEVAKKFNYKISTVYSLVKDAKAGKLKLFPDVAKGPKQRRTIADIQKKIIKLRKQNMYAADIHGQMAREGQSISIRTVERIIREAGFKKLKRRTNLQLGVTAKNKLIGEHSKALNFASLPQFSVDCPVIGVFFLFLIL